MNGLEPIVLKSPGLLVRLLGRTPRENAYLEIHNLVASLPIYHISRDAVLGCLSRYGVELAEAKPRLLSLCTKVLQHFISDESISDDEYDQLQHLAAVFDLSDQDVRQIHSSAVQPLYERAVVAALRNKNVGDSQWDALNHIEKALRISQEEATDIYRKHAGAIYKEAFDNAIADGILSPQKENQLASLAEALRLNVKLGNPETVALIERGRENWRISQGEIPTLSVPIYLQQGEECAAYVDAIHYEPGTQTRYLGYSTVSASYTVAGVRFRSGILKGTPITESFLRFRGLGVLYLTNKRFLFNGSARSTQITLKSIIEITFYSDGIVIRKATGKDQVFKFTGDIDRLRIITDALMSRRFDLEARSSAKSSPRAAYARGSGRSRSATRKPSEQEFEVNNPYEILGVSLDASQEEIKTAYRRMVRMYHPDKVASLAPEYRAIAEQRMKEINAAYRALTKG